MSALLGFALGSAASLVLALVVYCELLACRCEAARLRARLEQLEAEADAAAYVAPEGLYSTRWLHPQPEVRA